MRDSRLEQRLIELSSLSSHEMLALQPRDSEERGYIQTLTYLGSLEPPAPSMEKMWTGHTGLMAGLEDARPRPLLTRLFGRPGYALRVAPVALTAAAILATASSAAVITDVTGTGTAFSEVLSAIGIKETKQAVEEPPPVVTPSARPPRAPFETRPGVIEDEPPFENNTPVSKPVETEGEEAPLAIPAQQNLQPSGQDGANPGNGGGNGIGVGQGGTPPGQGGPNPGNPGENGNGVGPNGAPPGQEGGNPGNGVGQDGMPSSQSSEGPGSNDGNGLGQGGTPPGQGGENPGNGNSGGNHKNR